MTEHLFHICCGVVLIVGLFVGLFAVLLRLDKRGVNTHLGQPITPDQYDLDRKKRKKRQRKTINS